jgi:hypothetical protein
MQLLQLLAIWIYIDMTNWVDWLVLGICILLKQHNLIELELWIPAWAHRDNKEDDNVCD